MTSIVLDQSAIITTQSKFGSVSTAFVRLRKNPTSVSSPTSLVRDKGQYLIYPHRQFRPQLKSVEIVTKKYVDNVTNRRYIGAKLDLLQELE
jgi:hypothetical protein